MSYSVKVRRRSTKVLEYLEEFGPSVATVIAAALLIAVHLVRSALGYLVDTERAHIAEYGHVIGRDGRPHAAIFYAAGPGINAEPPDKDKPLDFDTGAALSPLIVSWASERAKQPAISGTDEELGLA